MYQSIKFLSIIVIILLISASIQAQQSTTGPEPPPGTDMGLQLDKKLQTVISGIPTYIWQHGCGPTALGMVIGYYDAHGYPDLVPGDASSQNSAVNAMIAGDSDNPSCADYGDHYRDYACPIDYSPHMYSDLSETGGAHASNCLADFMMTSRSYYGNYYGWSWFNDVESSFEDYVDMIDPSLKPTGTTYRFSQFTWDDFVNEIDHNRPVVLLVDTDGDNNTDHFVPAVGYDDVNMAYACYNTWDHSLHWYLWYSIGYSQPWSIYGVTAINFYMPSVVSTSPVHNSQGNSISGNLTVTFDVDMNPASFDNTTINVSGVKSGAHTCNLSYDAPSRTLTIDPVIDFETDERVLVYVRREIESITGASMDFDDGFDFYTACCIGMAADVNCEGGDIPDMSDIVRLIDHLYLSKDPLCCPEEAETNGDCGVEPDISDIVRIIDYLYLPTHTLPVFCGHCGK